MQQLKLRLVKGEIAMKSWEDYQDLEDALPNHVLAQRVARSAGVSTQSIHRAAKKRYQLHSKRDRRHLAGCPCVFISLDFWESYMNVGGVERLPEKPRGWLTSKAVLDMGVSKGKLYQAAHTGEIAAVYVGNTLYFEPDEVNQWLAKRHRCRPLSGWIAVRELKTRAQCSKQAVSAYLKRKKIMTRQFLHPSRDQLVQYVSEQDAKELIHSLRRGETNSTQPVRMWVGLT
jgi:excisionase family DNA binding protein